MAADETSNADEKEKVIETPGVSEKNEDLLSTSTESLTTEDCSSAGEFPLRPSNSANDGKKSPGNDLGSTSVGNCIQLVGVVAAILFGICGGVWGLWTWWDSSEQSTRLTTLEMENVLLGHENTRLSESALNQEAMRRISSEAASLGGTRLAVEQDGEKPRRRLDHNDKVKSNERELYSLNLSAIYGVVTHANVLADEAVDVLVYRNRKKATLGALEGNLVVGQVSSSEATELRSDFVKRYVLPFLFGKAKVEDPSVRGSILIVCSKLLTNSHRKELSDGSSMGGIDSLKQFGDVFSDNDYRAIEFRGYDTLNFSGLPLHHSTFQNADLNKPIFTECSMAGLDATNAIFRDATFDRATSEPISERSTLTTNDIPVTFDSAKFYGITSLKGTHFPSPRFVKAEFHGQVTLDGAAMPNANFSGTVFSSVEGRQPKLRHSLRATDREVDLRGSNFSGAQINDIDAQRAIFAGCPFHSVKNGDAIEQCIIRGASFEDCNFVNAEFSGTIIGDCRFTKGCIFVGTKFNSSADSGQTRLDSVAIGDETIATQLKNVIFDGASIASTSITNAQGEGVSFRGTVFAENVRVNDGVMRLADFRGAIFQAADEATRLTFNGTDLWGADFRGCSLVNLRFKNVDLTWALIPFEQTVAGTVGQKFDAQEDVFISDFDWRLPREKYGAVLVSVTPAEAGKDPPGTFTFEGFVYRDESTLLRSPTTAYHMMCELQKLTPEELCLLLVDGFEKMEGEEKAASLKSWSDLKSLMHRYCKYQRMSDVEKKKENYNAEEALQTFKDAMLSSRWAMVFTT